MRDQAGEKGETEEARVETGTGEAAVRQNREEKERKNRKLSSRNRKRSRRKEADWKGKARRRKQKGSTGGTAVGAKPGGMKGNEQKAEYEEPGRKTWETRSERTGKTKEARAEGSTEEATVRQRREERG